MALVYERVAAEMEPNMRFLKVDTEREPELAARYGILAIPTLMVLRKGAVLDRRAGAVDPQTLRGRLRQYAPGETRNAMSPARLRRRPGLLVSSRWGASCWSSGPEKL